MDGLSFELTEEQRMLQEMARDFALNEIAPVAEHYDRTSEFPWPVVEKARALGLVNTNVPEAYGGAGLEVLEEGIVGEELAYGCSGISTAENRRDAPPSSCSVTSTCPPHRPSGMSPARMKEMNAHRLRSAEMTLK